MSATHPANPVIAKPVILVVEDHPDTLDLLYNNLRDAGFKIVVARSGEAALRQVGFSQPDMILLDVKLPGIDGFETCRRLKQQEMTHDIPVIFMTGLAETVDKVKGFDAGGVDYLTKPFQTAEVLARVNTQLTIRTFQQQLQEQNALLEEQNARFQKLSEATFEGIVIHDNGDILEVNQTFERMFGYQRLELIGRNALEFVVPAFRDIVRQHIFTGDEHLYEAEAIRKSGEFFPIEVQARTMPYQGKDVRIAAVRDLSWHKAIEEKRARLEKENIVLKSTIKDRYKFGDIIGKSPVMQEVYELVASASVSEVTIMLTGESGTGKELVAHTIHQLSDRRPNPFVAVNCGAVPAALFESEFFGYRKGAFTGADRDKKGFFDQAHQGTLFLDEVAELSPALQVKLLRALDQGEYRPLGSDNLKTVNVRIIAATNRNLEEQLRTGLMRADFFYRIQVVAITLPPLRERREDIPLLIDHFLEQYRNGDDRPAIPGRVRDALSNYDWPGNIRQLQNVLQRYLTVKRLDFLHPHKPTPAERGENSDGENSQTPLTLREALETFEKRFILTALEQHRWQKLQTAQALGLERKTLYRKMKKFDIL